MTFLSSLFGALAVGGFFLCTRKFALTLIFGLSHMLWWLSCVAEVQTMNLAFTVFETLFVLRFLSSGRGAWLVGALFLSGVHLNCHNFALLALPVYGALMLKAGWKMFAASGLVWLAGASYWLSALVTRGPVDVLFGGYGRQVAGVLPQNLQVTGFNFALMAMSFVAPLALAWWNRKQTARIPPVLWALFAVNALFLVRYFVPDQATFLLPTLFFAFLIVSRFELRRDRAIALAVMQLILPLLAYQAFSLLPAPRNRSAHRYRNDAKYFAFPWKFDDDSADRYAAELGGEWNGYPDCGRGGCP